MWERPPRRAVAFAKEAGDLWANVPRTTVVEGSAAFDQLVQTLRSHGIAEKTR